MLGVQAESCIEVPIDCCGGPSKGCDDEDEDDLPDEEYDCEGFLFGDG